VSYTAAALVGAGAALVLDLFVLRTRLVMRGAFWATYPIIVFFQLVSNGILTGRNIVRYDPAAIIGWRLVYAPAEDLVFGFALVLTTLSLWVWWGRRGVQPTPRAGDRPAGGIRPGGGWRRWPGRRAPRAPRTPGSPG
jgi:lycopene cyclase domain-containing protein